MGQSPRAKGGFEHRGEQIRQKKNPAHQFPLSFSCYFIIAIWPINLLVDILNLLPVENVRLLVVLRKKKKHKTRDSSLNPCVSCMYEISCSHYVYKPYTAVVGSLANFRNPFANLHHNEQGFFPPNDLLKAIFSDKTLYALYQSA